MKSLMIQTAKSYIKVQNFIKETGEMVTETASSKMVTETASSDNWTDGNRDCE